MKPIIEYVYFIQVVENGPIKIGKTRNIASRLISLQSGNHEKIVLLYSLHNTKPKIRLIERSLHDRFKRHKIRGEWFRANPEILDHIEQLRKL